MSKYIYVCNHCFQERWTENILSLAEKLDLICPQCWIVALEGMIQQNAERVARFHLGLHPLVIVELLAAEAQGLVIHE